MVAILQGDRIGKTGVLAVGCEAAIFDESGARILIIRRRDNGMWCQPGGHIEPGESVAEACAREVREETGLEVEVLRLVGIYSDPHRVAEYADGNRFHAIVLSFEARMIGGSLHDSDESSEMGFFTPEEIKQMDYMMPLYERIMDAFARREAAFVR
ncbi:MAG: NUDIX domain-containing protein [Anaerolineaceae bacterium]|jgi:ADP-ribose pyrophosphatase YjhB (NUDIX family)|nr:NUDIX domain-containing protein [Anaerolineaceae bacterium]